MQEMPIWSLGGEDLLEEYMETHTSILAWKIPWTEEPGRPRSMGSKRVRYDWAVEHSAQQGLPRWLSGKKSACQCRRHGFYPWVRKILCRKKWQPTPVFLPGKSQEQRRLGDYIVHGAAKGLDMTWWLNNHSAHLDKWIKMFLRCIRVNIQNKEILKSFTENKNGILFWLEA